MVLFTGPAVAADPAAEIESATGAHARIVWVQDQSAQNADTLARGRKLTLMGLDSRDGKGERAILSAVRNYAKPLLTPDGRRVVHSDHFADKVYVVDWDGSGRRAVCDGFALDVWADPADGTQWVYVCRRTTPRGDFVYRDVSRVKLDDPKVREPVWSETRISPDNFQLSADGTRAAGEFPWPGSGVADLAKRTWSKRSTGCWASLAPDDSYVCAVFDGPHRNWQMHSAGGEATWTVNLAGGAEFGGHEAFHPRWSNHVRFLTLTGPYKVKGRVNEISGGGPDVEVYLAKLSEKFDRVESWVRVTRNQRGDFHPDAWIEGGSQTTIPAEIARREQPARREIAWPVSHAGLIFAWENAGRQNDVRDAAGNVARTCRVEPRGRARFDRFFAMECGAGWFEPEGIDAPLLAAIRAARRFSLEVLLTATGPAPPDATPIVSFVIRDGTANFVIEQEQSAVFLRMLTKKGSTERFRLCDLLPDKPRHIALSCLSGAVGCALDGEPAASLGTAAIDFSAWSDGRLIFGAGVDGHAPWRGRLERVAVYDRVLSPDEVRQSAAGAVALVAARRPAPRVKIEAELVEATAVPDPTSILPYRRALVVHHYRVRKVVEGKLADREVLVARWAILDGRTIEDAAGKPGRTALFTLENADDHPELKSERQLLEVEQLDLPMYYDVKSGSEERK